MMTTNSFKKAALDVAANILTASGHKLAKYARGLAQSEDELIAPLPYLSNLDTAITEDTTESRELETVYELVERLR
jgi:hypothetical protein